MALKSKKVVTPVPTQIPIKANVVNTPKTVAPVSTGIDNLSIPELEARSMEPGVNETLTDMTNAELNLPIDAALSTAQELLGRYKRFSKADVPESIAQILGTLSTTSEQQEAAGGLGPLGILLSGIGEAGKGFAAGQALQRSAKLPSAEELKVLLAKRTGDATAYQQGVQKRQLYNAAFKNAIYGIVDAKKRKALDDMLASNPYANIADFVASIATKEEREQAEKEAIAKAGELYQQLYTPNIPVE